MAKDKGVSPGPTARFNLTEFSRLIEGHGLKYRWSRAVQCSCTLSDATDQYDPVCARCVDGWRYVNPCWIDEPDNPLPYSPLTAVFSSITMDPTTHKWVQAAWTTGRGTLTVDGQVPVSFKDRFVSLSQRATFSEVRRRADADVIPVGWLGRTRDVQLTALRYEPLAVHYVEDAAGTRYRPGTDYVLLGASSTEPTRVSWVTGRGPATDVLYSISYDYHPVWTVEQATFSIQNSIGSLAGLTGTNVVQYLPTTFMVALDWLTEQRGA